MDPDIISSRSLLDNISQEWSQSLPPPIFTCINITGRGIDARNTCKINYQEGILFIIIETARDDIVTAIKLDKQAVFKLESKTAVISQGNVSVTFSILRKTYTISMDEIKAIFQKLGIEIEEKRERSERDDAKYHRTLEKIESSQVDESILSNIAYRKEENEGDESLSPDKETISEILRHLADERQKLRKMVDNALPEPQLEEQESEFKVEVAVLKNPDKRMRITADSWEIKTLNVKRDGGDFEFISPTGETTGDGSFRGWVADRPKNIREPTPSIEFPQSIEHQIAVKLSKTPRGTPRGTPRSKTKKYLLSFKTTEKASEFKEIVDQNET